MMVRVRSYLNLLIGIISASTIVLACGRGGGAQAARGSTPIRYVICSKADGDCFVQARFRSLEDCENARAILDAACDRVTQPRKIICDTTAKPVLAATYCVA
jgi:hypothetical protein